MSQSYRSDEDDRQTRLRPARVCVLPHLVMSYVREAIASVMAKMSNQRDTRIELALAKLRRREALVSLVRARQHVFIGIVGGAHRLSGQGRVRNLDR
jgi:hypothetical protein